MQTHNPPPQVTNTYQHYVENFQQQIIAQQDNSLQVYNQLDLSIFTLNKLTAILTFEERKTDPERNNRYPT